MEMLLVSGPDLTKARNSLSAQVRRAEQPPEDRDAVNATRRANDQVRRAEQPLEDRDDVNATRRVNGQVTISNMRAFALRALYTPVRLGVGSIYPKPKLMTHSSFDGPRSSKKRRRLSSRPAT